MMSRAQELCRKLEPILGKRINGLWNAYLAEGDPAGRADIEQTLELLAAKHLGASFMPDRSPFPPPPRAFAESGDLSLGSVVYADRVMYPATLKSRRLKEHILVAGRSGSGKTNLTFVLMKSIMDRGIKTLALDWKRGYRDLCALNPDLRVFTVGRGIAPFRFNPLIPPPGCEIHVWIKNIADVIASAYLGGEGVISLLVGGLDHLYRETETTQRWPTVQDLLGWLRSTKLKGRAAMWQASAERILLAMLYGEFAAVLNTQDNRHVLDLLEHNVILEMDGLSSASDRVLFSEALVLYLFRARLAEGPRDQLTNVIVLEEAHNLLLAKQPGSRESVLESSIRMIRQYGLGYVFVDQSPSMISRVAFANSYATIALSQKLAADVRVMVGAMNMNDEQQAALSTLPIGTAVVRLADEYPEPFLIRVPRFPITEGSVSDADIAARMGAYSGDSVTSEPTSAARMAVSPISLPDKNNFNSQFSFARPPSPNNRNTSLEGVNPSNSPPPLDQVLTRDAVRFLADLAERPLTTTVARYQRLHLSRRRGNAIRADLAGTGLIAAVPLATRSGQVMLYELTDAGRALCARVGIEAGPPPRAGLEHTYWARHVADVYRARGYDVALEHPVPGDGFVDVVATRAGECVAIEVETGKSDIGANITKLRGAGFDRVVLLATSPSAVDACRRAIERRDPDNAMPVELRTWLDVA